MPRAQTKLKEKVNERRVKGEADGVWILLLKRQFLHQLKAFWRDQGDPR